MLFAKAKFAYAMLTEKNVLLENNTANASFLVEK